MTSYQHFPVMSVMHNKFWPFFDVFGVHDCISFALYGTANHLLLEPDLDRIWTNNLPWCPLLFYYYYAVFFLTECGIFAYYCHAPHLLTLDFKFDLFHVPYYLMPVLRCCSPTTRPISAGRFTRWWVQLLLANGPLTRNPHSWPSSPPHLAAPSRLKLKWSRPWRLAGRNEDPSSLASPKMQPFLVNPLGIFGSHSIGVTPVLNTEHCSSSRVMSTSFLSSLPLLFSRETLRIFVYAACIMSCAVWLLM